MQGFLGQNKYLYKESIENVKRVEQIHIYEITIWLTMRRKETKRYDGRLGNRSSTMACYNFLIGKLD